MALQPFPVRHQNPKFVIIMLFGNDNDLMNEVETDLDAMARAAPADLAVLALVDTWPKPAQVVEITTNTRTLLEDLGEIDTGDSDLITELLTRALISYPDAEHVAIGVSGHGSGVFDELDPEPYLRLFPAFRPPPPPRPRALAAYKQLIDEAIANRLLDTKIGAAFANFYSVGYDRTGGKLTNPEIRGILRDGLKSANRKQVDLIFFDTCLNGMIEVVTEFEAFATCIVGSADLQPATGWNYREWLNRIEDSPPTDGNSWGRLAVDAMTAAYPPGTARPVTLSAVRAGSEITDCFRDLISTAEPFRAQGFCFLDWARSQSQLYGGLRLDSYDLLGFASHLAKDSRIKEISDAAGELVKAIEDARVHWMALGLRDANGIAFWFPCARITYLRDVNTYRELSFDKKTGWSTYLDKHR